MGKRTELYSNISSRRSPLKRLAVNNSLSGILMLKSYIYLQRRCEPPTRSLKVAPKVSISKKNLRLKFPWIWTSLLGKKLC